MHIPDGFIDAPTSLCAGVAAIAGIGFALRKTRVTLQERQAPLAGLAAAFVFAVQMLNFPVAVGTSGHLMGGLLAAVLVGPHAGALCVAVVLLVQALLFADGGLTAYGLNVVNMALITSYGGYAAFATLRRLLPRSRSAVVLASGIAAALSVVLSALGFALQYAIGGTGTASADVVTAAMVGVHVLIGVGEGVITALTVSAVLGSRPDLVYGAQDVRPDASLAVTA